MNSIPVYILLGLISGMLSGLMGIGGGLIIIPAFLYLFGMTQQEAQGTTLALLVPPIGILAAWTYYKHGFVKLPIALFVCLGFFAGSFLGANVAVHLSNEFLRRMFGILLCVAGLQMIFFK